MSTRPVAASVAVALTLAVFAGCGGGGGKKATTTSAPSSTLDSTPGSEPPTTLTTIDPALQSLLLVAADLPGFKEPTDPAPAGKRTSSCDSGVAPAITALFAAPSAEGMIFEKGADGAVKVSSSVTGATPEVATAGVTELVDPKVQACLEVDLKAAAERTLPSGTSVALKLTSAKATFAGVEQAVLLSGTATLKADTTASSGSSSPTSKTAKTIRYDLAFLRSSGTVLAVSYSGPADQATTVERQRIVAIAAKKLAGSGSGPSTSVGVGGSTTSSLGGSTTSRKPTTTTTKHSSTTTTKKPAPTSTTATTLKP